MIISRIFLAVVDGEAMEVESAVKEALKQSVPAEEILNNGLILAMDEVGKRFEDGEYFVPEMLISARAMQVGLKLLKPHLTQAGVKAVGIVAIGTVQGDLHDIGKNLVVMMLEGAGFEVRDLGVNVAPEAFIRAAQEGAQVIGISALLTTTMYNMQTTIEALISGGVRNKVKVIVGGAPVQEEFAAQIGADGFAPDASNAVRIVKSLIKV